jgi:hypothetical protein
LGAVSGYKVERANYTGGSCGAFSQVGATASGVDTFNDTGLSFSSTYCYRARTNVGTTDGPYSSVAQVTTPPSNALLTCGATGSGCYDSVMAEEMGHALLPDGSTQVDYVAANTAFSVWQEHGGTRILQASGVWASAADWQKSLTLHGELLAGNAVFAPANVANIAGRACPTGGTLPSVFIDDTNKAEAGYCLYYDDGSAPSGHLNAAGTSQTIDGQIGLDTISTVLWYEGNVQVCSNKGMRLPTLFETATGYTSETFYPTDIVPAPTFAGASGIPSTNWIWTATAFGAPYSGDYAIWVESNLFQDDQNSNFGFRCVLP